MRTIISDAVTKSALHLIPDLIKLQRANGLPILSSSTSNIHRGVHEYLYAAAAVLQRRQDERLRSACMLSDMGDGAGLQ